MQITEKTCFISNIYVCLLLVCKGAATCSNRKRNTQTDNMQNLHIVQCFPCRCVASAGGEVMFSSLHSTCPVCSQHIVFHHFNRREWQSPEHFHYLTKQYWLTHFFLCENLTWTITWHMLRAECHRAYSSLAIGTLLMLKTLAYLNFNSLNLSHLQTCQHR